MTDHPNPSPENNPTCAKQLGSTVAILHAVLGRVELTDGQPTKIYLLRLNEWLPDLQKVIDEINADIRQRVPFLGPASEPEIFESPSESSLYALSDIIAERTRGHVRLVLLGPDDAATATEPSA
jgi:hypothetical protein